MRTEAELRENLRDYNVPSHLHDGLVSYVTEGVLPGNFLCAVLENDLMGAVVRADPHSLRGLKDLCGFINMCIPDKAHGSSARVREYAAERQKVKAT